MQIFSILTLIAIVSWCSIQRPQQTIPSDIPYSWNTLTITWNTVGILSWKEYVNQYFGIKLLNAQWSDNFIVIKDWNNEKLCEITNGNIHYPYCITKFTKSDNETMDLALEKMIEQQRTQLNWAYYGEDIDQCVITGSLLDRSIFTSAQSGMYEYNITLDWNNISYSTNEQKAIRSMSGDWLFDSADHVKAIIYNNRLAIQCWQYTSPLLLGTSKQIWAKIIYNPSISTTTYYYLPVYADPVPFMIENIEILPSTP